jgi:NTE family protein
MVKEVNDLFDYSNYNSRELVTIPPKKSKSKFNLCFEGGGIRGLSYAGVARSLEKHSITIDRLVGSSAGSIFAGLLACGATSELLEETVLSTDFTKFMDGWGWRFGITYRMWYKMGMYNGDYFVWWYGDILQKLTGDSNITLKTVYEKYGKEITITSTDISNRKTNYINYKTDPDLPLKNAVRMSMSIPYIFAPVLYKGVYHVDGGYLDNYPIEYLDRNYPNEDTLGFRLSGSEARVNVDGLDVLTANLLESAIEKIEYLEARAEDNDRTVEIDTGDISSTDFDICLEAKKKLIQNGFEATERYFSL